MRLDDFYDKNRKERKVNFLGDFGVVMYFIKHRYSIKQGDLFLLFKLHSLPEGKFIKEDFKRGKIGMSYDNHKFQRMLNDDWIEVFRARSGSRSNFNVYRTTRKCNRMIERFYKLLLGEEFIPETPRANPIFRKDFDGNKHYRTKIKNLNEELREKLRNR